MVNSIRIITWLPRKFQNYTKALNIVLEASTDSKEGVTSGLEWTSKFIGQTTGAAGVAKGTMDAAEAPACQYDVCFIVSCVGITADSLQIAPSFVSGPNVAALVQFLLIVKYLYGAGKSQNCLEVVVRFILLSIDLYFSA